MFYEVTAIANQTFPTAAASRLKHLTSARHIDFYYEVVTGNVMYLSVRFVINSSSSPCRLSTKQDYGHFAHFFDSRSDGILQGVM